MTTLENLPKEVMIEILSRLPPEVLHQFKFISKFWYALINDPTNSSLQYKFVLLKRLLTNNSVKKELVLSILPLPLDPSMSSFVDVRLPFHEDLQYVEIHGCSHGLVCLGDISKDIFLGNPSSGEFRKLPPSILLLTEPPIEPDGYHSLTNAIGFGYDSKSSDFKVVRIVDFMEGAGYFYPHRVEIYDLSKDKWREIESPPCGVVLWMSSFEMYHEGIYYWWAMTYNGEHLMIQTFDMSEEIFGQILVPNCLEYDGLYTSTGILNGSIVLFQYPASENERSFDIWGMEKDESGVVSWLKLFTIDHIPGIKKPLLFVNSDELLMEVNQGRVILFNIKTLHIKELPIKGHPDGFHAIFYTKSSMSVKGGNN